MDKTLPVEREKPQGDITPPVDSPDSTEINELIQKQLKAFQEEFKKQFDNEYKSKLAELQNNQNELEEKKQYLKVIDELKAANMDSGLIDFVYDRDIEVSKVKIKQLKDLITVEVQKGVEERIKQISYTPPNSNGNIDTNKPKPRYFIHH